MEREALLCLRSAAFFGLAVWVSAAAVDRIAFGKVVGERRAWWLLIAPIFPGLMAINFLVGWALQESDPADEWAGALTWLVAVWMTAGVVRALIRALAALRRPRPQELPIATVGILWPRVTVAEHFVAATSPEGLSAALAHEAAHCRAYDPLRIWLAQLLADLQWPLPGAGLRLQRWLLALEMRRDDEAIAAGADPTALAEAILVAARGVGGRVLSPGVEGAGDGSGVGHRVRRLLASPEVPGGQGHTASRVGLALAVPVLSGTLLWLGFAFGEGILRALPGV